MGVISAAERFWEETGPAVTTVDPADIRGLVTTLLGPSGTFLGLGSRVGMSRLLTRSRVAPNRGRASFQKLLMSQPAMGTSRAMAHMNAASSRAMAVTTTLGFLPRAVRRRNLLHNRT